MEIIPAVGLPVAKVGQTQAAIEAVVGLADDVRLDPDSAYWHKHVPAFVAHFSATGVAELIEVYYSQGGREQATLGGIKLTFRLMDDVRTDLELAGMHGRPTDIGFEYDEGFCLWSMGSLSTSDLTGEPYDPDDERMIVEGVSMAPIAYGHDDA